MFYKKTGFPDESEIVLCTVKTILYHSVFVELDEYQKREGMIHISEISPGRIRNLRDYVVPKKTIVCKVLRISGNRVDLSLRRVTQKEQREVMNEHKQERSYKNILKSVLGKDSDKIVEKILEENKLYSFLQEAKENPKELEALTGKPNSEKILNILNTQKQKKAIVKKIINLTSTEPEGLKLIKEVLTNQKNADIKYISAGKYSIKIEDDDIKSADNMLKEIISKIEKQAKEKAMNFSVK